MSNSKKGECKGSQRRWTKEEIEKFSEILVDPTNNYAASLEELALKKSSNNQLFEDIKNNLDEELNDCKFKFMNIEKNFTKDGHPILHKTLDTLIERLRNKYKALKQEWSKLTTRIKSGSDLSPQKKSVWFKHLDPVFCETNEEMKLTSIATETSFLNEQDGEYEEVRSGEEDIFSGTENMDKKNELESEIEASNELNIGNATSGDKRKVVVAPHRKTKQVRSNKQALSEIANGLKALAETSQMNKQIMIEEEERKQEERYLSLRREEAEKNRQHELLIAQIFANASQPQFPYRSQPGHQGNSSTSSTSDPYQPVQDAIRRDSSFYPF